MDYLARKKLLYGFSISIVFIFFITTALAIDTEQLKPKPEDIERAKKYEYLKNSHQLGVESLPLQALSRGRESDANKQIPTINSLQRQKEKYLFYLFSKSVPDETIISHISQSNKLKGINFFGVLRGVDKERKVLSKIQQIKSFDGVTVKINPLIFRHTKANMVPAFVYAFCPPKDAFRSDDCEFKMILYGDLTLIGALESMSDRDSDIEKIYKELKDVL